MNYHFNIRLVSLFQTRIIKCFFFFVYFIIFFLIKIENGNGECVKETTTQTKIKKQQKATNGSSMQPKKIPQPGVNLFK